MAANNQRPWGGSGVGDDADRGGPPRRGLFSITSWRTLAGGASLVLLLFIAVMWQGLVESVGPDDIVVVQSPWSGRLSWYTQPGPVWQGFGGVTHYPKRGEYKFDDVNNPKDGIVVRFNDGGHGTIFGSIQYELPLDEPSLNALHAKYRDADQVLNGLVITSVNRASYLVGTLMSSRESYAEKRNDLIHYVTDQVQNGVYRTAQVWREVEDPLTKEKKGQVLAEIAMKDGEPQRQETSPLDTFKIHAFNFAIKRIPYDATVEKQITQQQEITMNVQTSIAQAKQAEQRALTVAKEGEANAAEAKWKQETIKAKETTQADQVRQVALIDADREAKKQQIDAERDKKVAETQGSQRLAVATLDRQSAEQEKQKLILLGEGQAEQKKLVLAADGALEQKLLAWVESQRVWASALANYKGSIVPSTVMGSGAGVQQANGVQTFMDLLTANAAKQLSFSMEMPSIRPVAPAAQR